MITLIRIWVTTLIKGESNAEKIYSIIALLTCLEALFGVINACLPVMKPALIQIGHSKFLTWASPTFFSTSRRSRQTPHSGTVTSNNSIPKAHFWNRMKHQSAEEKEMGTWSEEVPEANKLRHIGAKPASMMFDHINISATGRPGVHTSNGPPRPPPKSMYYSPERPNKQWSEEINKTPGIMVQRDWDVERQSSDEIDRDLLERKNPPPKW